MHRINARILVNLILGVAFCVCQKYAERNPIPPNALLSAEPNLYEEDYTDGYYFDDDEDKEVFRWNVEEFPNPQHTSTFMYCNRMKSSFVCDPDNVLEKNQADSLDLFIRNLYRETPCICDTCQSDDGGIVIGIAILKHTYQPYNEHPSKIIRTFAERLRDNWKLGKCDNDILILVATNDRLSYTDVGKATSAYVSLQEAHRIFLENKSNFSLGNFYTGLQAMLEGYEKRTRGIVRIHKDDIDVGLISGVIVAVVVLLGLVILLVVVVYKRYKKKKLPEKYNYDERGKTKRSWTKKDISVMFNSLKSTATKPSSTKYEPCRIDDVDASNTFKIGDEVINTTLAVPDEMNSTTNGLDDTTTTTLNDTTNDTTSNTTPTTSNSTTATSSNRISKSPSKGIVNMTQNRLSRSKSNGTSGTSSNGTSGTTSNGPSGTTSNGTSGTTSNGTSGTTSNRTSGTTSNGTPTTTSSGMTSSSFNGTPRTIPIGTRLNMADNDVKAVRPVDMTAVSEQFEKEAIDDVAVIAKSYKPKTYYLGEQTEL